MLSFLKKKLEEKLEEKLIGRKPEPAVAERPIEHQSEQSKPEPPVEERPFEYHGYQIPHDLLMSTGGGPDTFQQIIDEHMKLLREEVGISSESHVIEVGCGIGRDAFPLSEILSSRGSYLGIDVIERSIRFCQDNITPRCPNFRFIHFDVFEAFYNPNGKYRLQDLKLPVSDGGTDVILLHSVFTHLMEDDIVHYLKEFSRVLKPTGRVLATFFVVDDEIRKSAELGNYLSFKHRRDDRFYIEDPDLPTRAIGYPEAVIREMANSSGLELAKLPLFGFWSGHHPGPHYGGQDAFLFKRRNLSDDRC